MSDEQPERFAPTSGRLTGVVGMLIFVGLAVAGIVDRDAGFSDWVIALLAAVAALIWAATLRPRLSLVGDDLEMRNMFETVTIPLAAIEELAVRQVLAVRVGDKRFLSPALGKTRRQLNNRPSMGGAMAGKLRSRPADERTIVNYPDFVEERIRQRMQDARDRLGIRAFSDEQRALAEQVRRVPAIPEIVALGGLTLAAVVTLVV